MRDMMLPTKDWVPLDAIALGWLKAKLTEPVAVAPAPLRFLPHRTVFPVMPTMMRDVIEAEAGCWIVVIFAVAPVLMRIIPASRSAIASFRAGHIKTVTMALFKFISEFVELNPSFGFELSSKTHLHPMFTRPHSWIHSTYICAQKSCCSSKNREESHF
jgi:hypothetical protein